MKKYIFQCDVKYQGAYWPEALIVAEKELTHAQLNYLSFYGYITEIKQ